MKKSEVSTVANNSQIITFGCRLNIYESEIIRKNLQSNHLNDVIIFNTCTVTKNAEYQAKKAIRKAKRENPQAKIIVTGCAAQSNPATFAQMPEVDKILGNEEKLHAKFYDFNLPAVIVNDIMSVTETAEYMVEHFVGKTRAFIQVQNGCNHRCTFCIIPHVRGNSRSVAIGAIVQQIRLLVAQGYKEVVFTGVDLTSYGSDLPGTPTLAQMIKRVLALVPTLPRLRLSSLDVAEIDDELFNLLVHQPRLMPHIHISLQAGDNMILKRMKRRHTREQVVDFCLKLRNLIPDISFGADIIAGFPTESPEMFDNSLKLISEAGLQYLHVFPYSQRPNTPASRMPQVAKHIRKQRANMLIAAGKAQIHTFFQRYIGKVVSVLVEQEQFGHSENFIPISITTKQEIGSIVNVKLIGINNDNNVVGEAITHG